MDTLTLSQLAGELRTHDIACEVHGNADPTVTGTACDSRAVRAGDLFVCKGAAFRPAFLASARQAGAVAYLAAADKLGELAAAEPGLPALAVPAGQFIIVADD